MALQKTFDWKGSTFATAYWRIIDFDFKPEGSFGKVTVAVYSTEAARTADGANNILTTKDFMSPASGGGTGDLLPNFATVMAAFDGTTEGARDYLYTVLKDTTTLTGATDV